MYRSKILLGSDVAVRLPVAPHVAVRLRIFHGSAGLRIGIWQFLMPLLIALITACMSSTVQAAEINCGKAVKPAENLLCGDVGMRAMDRDLDAAYRKTLKKMPDPQALRNDQRNWLRDIRDRCEDAACLRKAYARRTAYLQEVLSRLSYTLSQQKICPPGASVPGKSGNCESYAVCATNSDYSILRAVVEMCGEEESASGKVQVYFHPTRDASPVLLETMGDEDMRSAGFSAPDANGYAQLNVLGFCGAGPNCAHDLYRYDPQSKVLYNYFSGAYADLIYFDGHLVESGRASCCSWEYRAHKLRREGARELVGDAYFAFSVSVNLEDDKKPANCGFYELTEGNVFDRLIAPPSRKWLEFCELYGPYRLLR